LALTAVAYALTHHFGLLPSGLGAAPEDTRWADWLDLLVPWLVLVPAVLTVAAAKADARTWALFGAGALAYASGHGIHLAANSVNNAVGGETAHLWDETVGHAIWYAGVVLVVAALARTMADRPRPPLLAHLLALGVGLTWATNAVGADLEIPGLLVALGFATYGWRHRTDLRLVLLTGFVPSAVLLVASLVA
jgi:hypothetical protein